MRASREGARARDRSRLIEHRLRSVREPGVRGAKQSRGEGRAGAGGHAGRGSLMLKGAGDRKLLVLARLALAF